MMTEQTRIVMRAILILVALGSQRTSSFSVVHAPVTHRSIHTANHQRSFIGATKLDYQKGFKTERDKKELSVLKSAFVNETDYTFSIGSTTTPLFENEQVDPLSFFKESFWAPRVLLAAVACIYGTNFALGAVMEDALPASAATCARMVLAALALSPFVFEIESELAIPTIVAGSFTAMGYVTQSLALVDTSPATVSFLGAATVLVCPALQAIVDRKPMGWKDAPQTWIAAALCIGGVGVLELCGDAAVGTAVGGISQGHVLALLQAVGFGTGLFLSGKMVTKHPTQALPITSVMVATTAFASMVWCCLDGWMQQPDWQSMALPNLLLDAPSSAVMAAVLWTGLVSTSMNFFLEVSALGMVPSSEASVILATEPLWAALFASQMLGEAFGWNDTVGGILIVMACLANTLDPTRVHQFVDVLVSRGGGGDENGVLQQQHKRLE